MKNLNKDTYNKIADDWSKEDRRHDWMQEGLDSFISLIKKDGNVLDAGCGPGDKVAYLQSKGLQVTGIDFSEKMIEIAKRQVPGALFKVLDLYNLESLTTTFDGILLRAVLLHIPKKDIVTILKKCSQVLSVKGSVYIAVKEKLAHENDEEIKIDTDYGYPYERFFSYFDKKEMEGYLNAAGFKVLIQRDSNIGKRTWLEYIAQKQ